MTETVTKHRTSIGPHPLNDGTTWYSVGCSCGWGADEHFMSLDAARDAADLHEYEERGELFGTPDELPCWECTRAAGITSHDEKDAIMRQVVALGPIAEAQRDPTQTYRLSCGHVTF